MYVHSTTTHEHTYVHTHIPEYYTYIMSTANILKLGIDWTTQHVRTYIHTYQNTTHT